MRVCPNCGAQQLDESVFCDLCGAPLAASGPGAAPSPHPPTVVAVKCPSCGASIVPGESFCGNCGAPLRPGPASAPAPTCSQCGAPLQPGHRFCDVCGAALPVAGPPPSPAAPAAPPPAAPAIRGRLVLPGGAALALPADKAEIIIGREDPPSGISPDIDLTPHGGEENGVSRRHTRLLVRGAQLLVEDLYSTNYTYVNRLRLNPGQLYPLNDGDELRLGQLKLQYTAS